MKNTGCLPFSQLKYSTLSRVTDGLTETYKTTIFLWVATFKPTVQNTVKKYHKSSCLDRRIQNVRVERDHLGNHSVQPVLLENRPN